VGAGRFGLGGAPRAASWSQPPDVAFGRCDLPVTCKTFAICNRYF